MDILTRVGDIVLFWGRGHDAGATLPQMEEADAIQAAMASANAMGEPMDAVHIAAFRAGFRRAAKHLHQFGSAPRGRSAVNVSEIRALLAGGG